MIKFFTTLFSNPHVRKLVEMVIAPIVAKVVILLVKSDSLDPELRKRLNENTLDFKKAGSEKEKYAALEEFVKIESEL